MTDFSTVPIGPVPSLDPRPAAPPVATADPGGFAAPAPPAGAGGLAAGPRRWAAGSRRALNLPPAPVRAALLQAIRALGFTPTSEQFSYLEAVRGSAIRGLSMTRARVPVWLRVEVTSAGVRPDVTDGGAQVKTAAAAARTEVVVRLEDRLRAGRSRAAAAVYAEVFDQALTGLDDALKRLAPTAGASFDPWWRDLPESKAVAGRSTAASAARVESVFARQTSRLLDGQRKVPGAAAGAGVATVTLVIAGTGDAPGAVAEFPADVLDGMLTVGQLVTADPGRMPASLVAQVHALLVSLEARLAEAGRAGVSRGARIMLADVDRPVVVFLCQQATLREKLPIRVLKTCTTCHLDKVVNPDFERLRERNRKLKVLSGSVGVVFGVQHISAFTLVGRLAQVHKTDPDFVCPRCQGTDADERPITFCPRCGDRRDESVLRTCPRCDLELRDTMPKQKIWQDLPVIPLPARADAVSPAPTPQAPSAASAEPGASLPPVAPLAPTP
ncbi:MAG: hypothetical protein FWD74_10470, partial [Actinomycetia bacterium]|nr:hypothetical protein [Actinomycetes bacterium]